MWKKSPILTLDNWKTGLPRITALLKVCRTTAHTQRRTQPQFVNLLNILPLHMRKERSLWICRVTVEAGFCPHCHVLFNEPEVALTWFACACYRLTQRLCSFPLTLPQYEDILIPFFAWLVCQFTQAEGPWLNFFHQGGCWGFHLCALLHQGWRFGCFEVCERIWAYARVWSGVSFEADCVGRRWLPCEGKLWRK